jgi:hypothetical protein
MGRTVPRHGQETFNGILGRLLYLFLYDHFVDIDVCMWIGRFMDGMQGGHGCHRTSGAMGVTASLLVHACVASFMASGLYADQRGQPPAKAVLS